MKGNWKIVSASLQVDDTVARNYTLIYDDDEFDYNISLIPREGSLYWSRNPNVSTNTTPFALDFVDNRPRMFRANLIDPNLQNYKMLTSSLLETPRTNSNNYPIDFQRIECSDVVPWNRLKIMRFHYYDDDPSKLQYIVTAVLERR